MKRDRQFDHAKAGAEVTAGDRDCVDRLLPQFVGELAQLGLFQLAQVAWRFDQIEQWGLGLNGHANTPSY
jgi:hypothetical protein